MAKLRKLFQSGTAFVQLGTPPMNVHMYNVFAHRIRIICTLNNFAAPLAKVCPDDQAWIKESSVYVRCDKPLWELS